MRFTREEFDTMVNELLYKEPISFDMLCVIAEKVLRPTVVNWCKAEEALRGRGYEDDIMQEVHLRLIKTTVSYFLLRKGIEGEYNDDPEGFEDWMFLVAKNIKRDFASRIRNRDFNTDEITDDIPSGEDIAEEYEERLREAFTIVISSDAGIYKILTWLAQFIFILEYNVTKIKSNELIIKAFEDKTLYDMYEMLLSASNKISWMTVTSEQNEKILDALRKKCDSGVSYGETRYKDFFMKHNGEVSGKKSISDWMNRMNGMVKRKTDSLKDTNEKNSNKVEGKKRRGRNGASDS